MGGRHQFQDLTEGFTPERQRRIEAKKVELLAEMHPRELRQAMALTNFSGVPDEEIPAVAET